METVPLASLTTSNYQPCSDDFWVLERVWGKPTCQGSSALAGSPFLWALLLIILIIILLCPLAYLGQFGKQWFILYVLVVFIVVFAIIAWAGSALLRRWKQPQCQL